MPVMVSKVTDSKLIIGLIPALFTLGFYLPQLFSANLSERLAYKKPFVVLLGTGERLPYLIIAFVIWRWAIPNPTLALVLFFFLLGMAAFSGGYADPAWYDMIAKVIPVDRRGIWSGVGHGLGALMGIIGAYFVGYILQTFPYPDNFALLFVLGFVATAISWCGLILNREPPSSVVKEYIPLTHYLYRLPQIFHRDANYLRFILSRSLIQLGTMASGFYMVYGVQRFAIDGAGVGRLTALLIGSQAVMNLILGAVGDRHGHKLVLVLARVRRRLCGPSGGRRTITIVVGIHFHSFGRLSCRRLCLWAKYCLGVLRPQDRPTYIGLTNTLLAPVFALAPLIGGWLATLMGYQGMFLCAVIIGVLGGLLLMLWVREPRQSVRGSP